MIQIIVDFRIIRSSICKLYLISKAKYQSQETVETPVLFKVQTRIADLVSNFRSAMMIVF